MKKTISILLSVMILVSLTSCRGMSISEKNIDEISNYVLENIDNTYNNIYGCFFNFSIISMLLS